MPHPRLVDLAADQRPRERLVRLGPDALSDAELLALLLGSGRRGENVLDLARSLLVVHGGVVGLGSVDAVALARVPGIGPAKAARVVAALALASRSGPTADARPVLASSADLARVCAPLLTGRRRERVVVAVCGPGNRLLTVVVVAEGSAHGVTFPVREVLAEVLRRDGTAFGVAHQHPGGNPTPSTADVEATVRLAAAAEQVGVRFLDHVVLGGDAWRSARAPSEGPAPVFSDRGRPRGGG